MQPNTLQKYGYVDETAIPEINSETPDLFAISYADFLMTLLSFFVMFFSFGNEIKSQLVDELQILARDKSFSGLISVGSSTSAGSDYAKLESSLKGLSLSVHHETEGLSIQLPPNIFEVGSYRLRGESLTLFRKTLKALEVTKGQLDLVFVGFADNSQFAKKGGRVVQDNFDLSSLRATRAVQIARAAGFEPHSLFAMGSADNGRNTRSLSIVLRARRETK